MAAVLTFGASLGFEMAIDSFKLRLYIPGLEGLRVQDLRHVGTQQWNMNLLYSILSPVDMDRVWLRFLRLIVWWKTNWCWKTVFIYSLHAQEQNTAGGNCTCGTLFTHLSFMQMVSRNYSLWPLLRCDESRTRLSFCCWNLEFVEV